MTPLPRKYGRSCKSVRYLEAFPTTAVARTAAIKLAMGRTEKRNKEWLCPGSKPNRRAEPANPAPKASGQSYSAGPSRRGVPGGLAGAAVWGIAARHGPARATPEIGGGVFPAIRLAAGVRSRPHLAVTASVFRIRCGRGKRERSRGRGRGCIRGCRCAGDRERDRFRARRAPCSKSRRYPRGRS